ncbi:hypothetical protein ACIPSJ_27330 [Streptomyces sp. NPDC090088]|uniref:hypothetical protein n=1 Tax=Streptomyces sp. NPDC090088 TaxID=3365944 RepID=UPI003813D8B2
MASVIRVVTLRSQPDRATELATRVRDNLVTHELPPGLVTVYVVRDIGDAAVVQLISVFDGLPAMEANMPSLDTGLAPLHPILADQPRISSYEVVAHGQGKAAVLEGL